MSEAGKCRYAGQASMCRYPCESGCKYPDCTRAVPASREVPFPPELARGAQSAFEELGLLKAAAKVTALLAAPPAAPAEPPPSHQSCCAECGSEVGWEHAATCSRWNAETRPNVQPSDCTTNRAARAAEPQQPVAEVVTKHGGSWVNWHVGLEDLPVGTKLYAGPVSPETKP